jgi:sugar lactone lactonase YvrE
MNGLHQARGAGALRCRGAAIAWLAALAFAPVTRGQVDEHCVVSVLNRSVQAKPDGSWVLPNVPANFGRVRARATCVDSGVTRSGQSSFFLVPPNGIVPVVDIVFDAPAPIPESLVLTSPAPELTAVGATAQLTLGATYPGGATADLTAGGTGTTYTLSNPAIATINPDGLVTAVSSGTVLIAALHDGVTALLRVSVVLSGDTDGDGIADDVELANGLNPNDPLDALEDFDHDGLTNRREIELGTDLRNADSDGDTLPDGQEIQRGTDPLLFDTDGDGLSDGLEVATGSDPLDPTSYNLALALQAIDVAPSALALVVNTVIGEASRRLTVTGRLIDGTSLDLTARSRGTQYASSDLTVANFGPVDGEVFAGNDGAATVSVSNAGFNASLPVTVRSFAPSALSRLPIPGYANAVDVVGGFAYVASGGTGMQIVDVSDRANPHIVAAFDTPGNGNDVKVAGGLAYLADGASGLRVIDVSNPAAPQQVGLIDTPGTAQGVALAGPYVYVADGTSGLRIIDVSNPATPQQVGALTLSGTSKGVAWAGNGLVVVACGSGGVRIVDVSVPSAPVLRGSAATSDARDVAVDGPSAYVADFAGSLKVVNFSQPSAPQVVGSTGQTLGGALADVAKAGRFTFGADVILPSGVPIVDVSVPGAPIVRARLSFPLGQRGQGIAVDDRYVYFLSDPSETENGVSGASALLIGQYLDVTDDAGAAPQVSFTSPAPGASYFTGATVSLNAAASDDVAVLSVTFLADGVPLATTFGPYRHDYAIPLDAPAALAFQAVALDYGDNTATAEVEVQIAPDPPPVVAITSPAEGATPMEGATLTLSATASDNVSVTQVRLYVGTTLLVTRTQPPYQVAYLVPVGATSLTFAAEATDNLGHTTRVERPVNVAPDPLPLVALTAPPVGTDLVEGAVVTAEASASDNGQVTQVRFTLDGATIFIDPGAPYRAGFTVPLGVTSVEVGAEAQDNLGRTTRVTRTYAVVPDPPPSVSIVAPPEGTTLFHGDTVTFTAQATDNVRVARVRFVVGSTEVVDPAAPFEARVTVPSGIASLDVLAEATDNLGRGAQATRTYDVVAPTARLFVEPQFLSFSLPARAVTVPITHAAPTGDRRTAARARPAAPRSEAGTRPLGAAQPLHFEPAFGASAQAPFVARGPGYGLLLTPAGARLGLRRGAPQAGAAPASAQIGLRFAGARPDTQVRAVDALPGRSHYFYGQDPRAWRTQVPHYARVRYEQIYPGVDAVFHGNQQELEYDLHVAPSTRPEVVRLAFEGVRALRLDAQGDLLLDTADGTLRQVRPQAYQELPDGGRRSVTARYVLGDDHEVRFDVGAYDPTRPLVIDPILRYSTFLGGSGFDQATAVQVDAQGFIYVAGVTWSIDFPVLSFYQGALGGSTDAFVTKLTPDGSSVVYSTYLGGSGSEALGTRVRLALDAAGSAYVAGSTLSRDFPVHNAYQAVNGDPNPCFSRCGDYFVTKLDPGGSALVYSTYLGGGGDDFAHGLAVDSAGRAHVGGRTRSTNFPGTVLNFPFSDGGDAVVTILTPTGGLVRTLVFATTQSEGVTGLAIGPSDEIFVTGFYNSSSLFGSYAGGCTGSATYCGDTFIRHLTAQGNSTLYAARLGGSGNDVARDIAVDAAGNAYLGGTTTSANLPLQNPAQAGLGGGFVSRLDPTGATVYTSYVGGQVYGVAAGGDGSLYLTGYADANLVPFNPLQEPGGYVDALVAKLQPAGSAYAWSSPLGGEDADYGEAVTVDAAGTAYAVGYTWSRSFPVVGALQAQHAGYYDAYLVKIGSGDNVQFSRPVFHADEAGGSVEIAVTRGDGGDDSVTVAYTTVDVSASAPFDYIATSGTLTFLPGETRHTFSVPIVDDALVEGPESVELRLQVLDPPTGVVLGHLGVATLAIDDDDQEPPRGTATRAFVVRDRTLPSGPDWQASVDVPWLTLSQSSGSGPSTVAVTAESAGLAPGYHTGTITVTAVALDSPQVIQVSLQVGTEFEVDPPALTFSADDPARVGRITHVAGGGSGGDGGPAAEASLDAPTAVAFDAAGNLYVSDSGAYRVRRIALGGIITTFAGSGVLGDSGDGGPATAAAIGEVHGLAADASGNVYLADYTHHRVRRVDAAGVISTLAGTGSADYSGDGGPAVAAALSSPVGLALDGSGGLLIADAGNNRVRRVDAAGIITTMAGTGSAGYSGDEGPALQAELNFPVALAVDGHDNVYVADVGNHLLRLIDAAGTMHTAAGGRIDACSAYLSPLPGYGGEREGGWGSPLSEPSGVAADAHGNVYVAETSNHRVRKLAGGGIYTVAGDGTPGDAGDGGAANRAQLSAPWALTVDPAGQLVIADTGNNRVRRVGPEAILGADVSVYGTNGWTLGDWDTAADTSQVTATPASGNGDAIFAASVDATGLPAGTTSAILTVSTDQGLVTRNVALDVSVASAGLLGEPPVLFIAAGWSSAWGGPLTNLTPTVLHVFDSQDPAGPINWELLPDTPWLTVSQSSGSGPAFVTLGLDLEQLGGYEGTATLTLTADGAEPRTITLSYRLFTDCPE